ncbi:hypothetical protein [Tessaracoccus lacteus]|uniref:Uncharacterized protein n=1 Tax=Tessaracoccus lacteus TaxID=3041766 RepID=A0ABY8PXU1_9ACTN|nr:hypothetical protein [Tessaracoccus sp. T21]WGT47116.1 hypothetical protein QH948_13530 [Tessaracoccus sp. T21]
MNRRLVATVLAALVLMGATPAAQAAAAPSRSICSVFPHLPWC